MNDAARPGAHPSTAGRIALTALSASGAMIALTALLAASRADDSLAWFGHGLSIAVLGIVLQYPRAAWMRLATAALALVAAAALSRAAAGDRGEPVMAIGRALMAIGIGATGILAIASIWKPGLWQPARRGSRLPPSRTRTIARLLAGLAVGLAIVAVLLAWYVLAGR